MGDGRKERGLREGGVRKEAYVGVEPCFIRFFQLHSTVLFTMRSALLQDVNLDILDSFFLFGMIAINFQKQAIMRIQLVLVNHLSAKTSVQRNKTGSPPV